MLLTNAIPGLLDCKIGKMDDKTLFYYEVTSRQSLQSVFEPVSYTHLCAKVHLFCGKTEEEADEEEGEAKQMVWVTENGSVYHTCCLLYTSSGFTESKRAMPRVLMCFKQ